MGQEIYQADCFWAYLPAVDDSSTQMGARPVLIVSNDTCCKYSPVIQVVPFTANTEKKPLATHVNIGTSLTGKESIALCEQVMQIPINRLDSYIGKLPNAKMQEIKRALAIQFSIQEPIKESRKSIEELALEEYEAFKQDEVRLQNELDYVRERLKKLLPFIEPKKIPEPHLSVAITADTDTDERVVTSDEVDVFACINCSTSPISVRCISKATKIKESNVSAAIGFLLKDNRIKKVGRGFYEAKD